MVAEKLKLYTVDDVLDYIGKSCLLWIGYRRDTKSIYFKDDNGDITCFIQSLQNKTTTILATINGDKVSLEMSNEQFNILFNQHKIFIVK